MPFRPRHLAAPAVALALLALLSGCAGEPDRADVRAGLIKEIRDNPAEVSEQVAEETADCMLDRLWDTVDTSTLQVWADGTGDELTDMQDTIPVLEASRECSAEAAEAERAALPVPTTAEIRAGLIESIPDSIIGADPTEAQAGEIADCMLERLGDDLDDETKRAWAEGTGKHSVSLNSAVSEALEECGRATLAP